MDGLTQNHLECPRRPGCGGHIALASRAQRVQIQHGSSDYCAGECRTSIHSQKVLHELWVPSVKLQRISGEVKVPGGDWLSFELGLPTPIDDCDLKTNV